MEPKSLSGRSIVIVGGTTGLGLSAARACVAQGARLILVGRKMESAEQARLEFGENAHVVLGDAADSSTSETAVSLACEAFGGLDGLYHVAGGSGRSEGDGPLHELSDDGLEKTLQSNLHSLIYSNRAAVRMFLMQGRGGTILNMTSVLAFSPAPAFFATHAYAAAKAAAVGFTRSCAAFYAPQNIRFNALAPALVETPMSRRSTSNAKIMDYIATKQPLDGGRIGQASDLDGAVLHFLSDASRFTTGQILSVDGGWSVSEGNVSR